MSNQFYKTSPFKYKDPIIEEDHHSPNKANNQKYHQDNHNIIDVKAYTLSNPKFIKNSPGKNNQCLPPKSTPFQRTQRGRSKEGSFKDRSTTNVSLTKKDQEDESAKDSRSRADSVSKVTDLKKKISQQIAQKNKWKEISEVNAEKVAKLSAQLSKIRESNKWYQEEMNRVNKNNFEVQNELRKANQAIEHLQKTVNNNAIHLNSIKLKDHEIEQLKSQIKKISFENQSLSKTINAMKTEIHKKNVSHFQQECIRKSEIIVTLERQIDKLNEDLKNKSQNQQLLEFNLRETQRVLYQRQAQLKKLGIQMTFLGRKQAMSIDDVKSRKDLQIKIIRDKFNKVTKDLRELKESKEKDDKGDKRKFSKQKKEPLRKIKSHKNLRMATESDQFTFELSSQI